MIDKTERTAIEADCAHVLEDKEICKCKSISDELQSCISYAYQQASVSVPVELIPFAEPGNIKTFCCGEPKVKSYRDDCTGNCNFTIMQCICVEIPVTFGANAFLGESHVSCGNLSNEDICTDCNPINNDICKDDNFTYKTFKSTPHGKKYNISF